MLLAGADWTGQDALRTTVLNDKINTRECDSHTHIRCLHPTPTPTWSCGTVMAFRAVSQSLRISWSCFSGLIKSGSANTHALNVKNIFSRVRNLTNTTTFMWSRNFSLVTQCRPSGKVLPAPQALLQRNPPVYLLPSPLSQLVTPQQVRCLVKMSKNKGKRKTVKAVAKRFHRTGSGKLKYWPPGKVHNMLAKSKKKRRQLRKPRYATKTQLKTLNKMLAGW